MIELTIEREKYTGPSGWYDITLEQFIRVCGVPLPERLRALYVACSGLNETNAQRRPMAEKEYEKANGALTQRDLLKVFPEYYGKIIAILTTIPENVIDRLHHDVRTKIFDEWLRYVVLSAFMDYPVFYSTEGMVAYIPAETGSFELDGVEYLFPTTLKLYGGVYPMAEEAIITFAEAAEIEVAFHEMREQGVKRFPMFMALYCRPAGELYDEKTIMSRENIMQGVSMDKVWALFFCISRLLLQYNRSTRAYSKAVGRMLPTKPGAVASLISDGVGKFTR